MKNILRILALVLVQVCCCVVNVYGDSRHDAEFKIVSSPSSPDIKKSVLNGNEATFQIETSSMKVNCLGRGGFAFINNEDVTGVEYDLRVQYKVESEEWQSFSSKKGTWKAGNSAPTPWSGSLKRQTDSQNITVDSWTTKETSITIPDKYLTEAEVRVYFRFYWDLKMNYEGGADHFKTLEGTTSSTTATLYSCKGGTLGVSKETTLPEITNGVYGIYDTEEFKESNFISLMATTEPIAPKWITSAYYYDEKGKEYGGSYYRTPYPYQTSVKTIKDFESYNDKTSETSWSYHIRWVVDKDKNNCESNSITFKHYKRIVLGKLKNFEPKRYICGGSSSTSSVTLEGVGVSAESVTKSEEEVYGIEYKWEYSLTGQYWNEVETGTNASYNGTNLTVNAKYISSLNVTDVIYFRPKAYLSTFNTNVYADANIVYEVIPYSVPSQTNMELKVSDKTVCEGKELGEGQGLITLKQKNANDVFNPNLVYTIEPSAERFDEVDKSQNELAKWKIEDALSENTTFTITVTDDECKSSAVNYETTIKVESVVSDPESEITLDGCSYEYDADGTLRIQVRKDVNITLGVNSKSSYKYSLYDNMGNILDLPIKLSAAVLKKSHKMTLQKRNMGVNSIRCIGDPIPVEINVVEDISGNDIWFVNQGTVKDNTYYLCKGSKNPEIAGTGDLGLSGGYGDRTIVWRFKNTGKQIPNSDSEEFSLSAGLFEVTEECEIVRVVKMGNGAFESVSNPLKIKPYSDPTFSMKLNDSVLSVGKICYDEMPVFNIKCTSEEKKAEDQIGKTTYNIKTYQDVDGMKKKVDSLIVVNNKYQGWQFKYDATISATQEFCGTSVDVVNSIDLNVKEDLTFKDGDFEYDCPTLGKSNRIYPKEGSSKYTFKKGFSVDSTTEKSAFASIMFPTIADGKENGNDYVNVQVTRSFDGCSKTQTIKIKDVLTSLESKKLVLNETLDQKNNLVCIAKTYKIEDNETEEANVKYSWSSKAAGANIQNATSKDVNVTLSNGNVLYRKRTLGNGCQIKTDSIKIEVLEKATSTPEITVSTDYACHNEELGISVEPISGYKVTSWKKDGTLLSTTASSFTEKVKSETDLTYEVEMTSNQCDNYVLSSKKEVVVAPNLEILSEDITVSPADINPSSFAESSSINVKVTDNKNVGQEFDMIKFYNSKFTKGIKTGGVNYQNFTLDESDITDDLTTFDAFIYRQYKFTGSTKTCVSDTFFFSVAKNDGFDPISINTIGNSLKAGDVFYLCGNGTLALESSIVYNGSVLDSKEYKLQWYKKTSSGVWFSMTDETKSSVKITTESLDNRSDYYKLVVSITKDGKDYKQSSNVIEVRNVAKPNLNILLTDGEMNFCHAGNVEFELQTITWSNPDGVVDAMNSYTWQKSYDGKDWTDLEANTTEDETVVITTSNDVSTLAYVETAMTKSTYFRAVMTNLCGTTAVSNTLLTKTYKGMDLVSKDVNVMSSKLVQDVDHYEVNFFVNYSDDKVYSYTFYNEDDMVIESKGTASQIFTYDALYGNSHDYFDYSFGKHKVYVEKVMKENGCKSEKVEVEYELIAPLKIEVHNSIANQCPKNANQSGNINLLYKEGGLSENTMTATWYYKFEDQEYYRKIDETVVDFKYSLMSNDQGNIENGRIYNINGLDRTCSFYAEIFNEGYPIKSVKMSTVTMEINPKFEIGRVTSDKTQYCYGASVELYAGNVKSSFGEISYIWKDLNENKIYPATETLELDAIYGQTTFRRIAYDECGVKDTFDIEISVREKLEMSEDEYIHAAYAEKGKVPYIAVLDLKHVDSYVVSHINQEGISDVTETKTEGDILYNFGTMPVVDFDIEKFEIYKVDKVGCKSVADTFTVAGIDEISAGTIAFEKYVTKSINICHGEKIGRIIDEKVANGGSDITYEWYYIEKGSREKVLDDKGLPVTTSVFDADSMKFGVNIATNVEKGSKIKTYALFRQASMNVVQPDGTYQPYIKRSDTLYVNVAPQLANSNIENLAGSIKAQANTYCGGVERSSAIVLTTDEDVVDRYEAKDFGALMFGEDYDLYGYWEASKGNKKNYVQISDAEPYEDFESKFFLEELDTTTYVRFTITDGCSTTSTNEIGLSVMTFDKDNTDNYTIDKQAVEERYIEEGDKIKVTNFEKMDNEWYSSKSDNGLIGTDYYVILDSVTFSTRLYHKRINEKNNVTCKESDYYEIPLNVHQVSKGGRISSSQQTCPNGEFADLKNYESAFGGTGDFKYRWEITTDTTEACSCWNSIDGAYEDTLNYATYRKYLDGKKTNFIRRTATPIYNGKEAVDADDKYTRYSNVVSLERYKILNVSELNWKEESSKAAYCSEESVPYIKTESPTGGSAEYKKSNYKLNWMYSVDGNEWSLYLSTNMMFGGTSEIYGNGIVYTYFEDKKRDKDVTFYVKAVFTDDECGEIESKPFSFKVWAETENPSLYIGADSCDSKYISFIVENKTDYLYNWTIGTDSVNPVKTDFKDKYEMDFERHPAYVVEAGYTVQGMHKVSGCKTGIVNFNVDSLPELQQSSVPAQSSILCYGSDLNIEHSAATGGTGTRSYLWQYSYDNEKWNDANEGKDFSYEDVRSDIYVRRLAFTDICKDTITTESALYKVADKVDPIQVSIEEHLCKNQDMLVSLDSMEGNFNVVVYRLDKDTIKETELTPEKLTGKIKGNDLAENIFGIVTWDSTYTCKSEMIKNTIKPRPDFTGVESAILSDAEVVCEGSSITITSSTDYTLPGYLKQRIETSKDGKTWSVVKDNSEYQEENKVVVTDTAYYRTILLNGCKDSIISNTVKVGGKNTIANPMTFDVETTSDGEIKIVGNNNVDMAALALVVNDSMEYDFKDKITLAKETEKVVVSSKIGVDGSMVCYTPVSITPMKEGNIFTECLSTGKQIVGEDVINAGSEITYKWYKFGNDTMMYFTDKTDKNYELGVDDEKSRLLRVAYYSADNINYVLKSNILTVNANGPALSKITALEKDSLLAKGLKVTDYYMELNIGMNATLSCFIDDASNGEWQRSDDGISWITADKFDSTHLASQILPIDPKENVYYRVVATNSCGTTTGDSMFVSVEDIPAITEGCLEITLDDCEKTAKIICYDDESKNFRADYYDYYFEVVGECENKTLEGTHGISLSGITGEIEVIVARSYKGVTTKYIKRIDMSKSVGASFSIIAEDVEYGSSEMSGAWLEDVLVTSSAEVPSGTKIQLNNRSENGKSYKWEVYYDGIKMATSLVENPQLYVYNEGVYSFVLTSYSGKCESTANWESGVRVQTGTLRSATIYDVDDFMFEPEFVPLKKKAVVNDIIEVYPTKFDSEIHVSCEGSFSYSIFGTNGMRMAEGEGKDATTINVENLYPGVYTIVVNGSSFRLIK